MPHVRSALALATTLFAGAAMAQAEMGATASATMMGPDGAKHGTVTFTETNSGVIIKAELTGLPPGPHGFHLHAVGQCEPPFESAGDHYNPTNVDHGFMAENGPHVGDMPNIHAPDSGDITVEILNAFVSLATDSGNSLFDDDGTALVIHADPDDYAGQPAGHAGDRIACGVVER
jgi:superoxide dismutase, Cu-Zn family